MRTRYFVAGLWLGITAYMVLSCIMRFFLAKTVDEGYAALKGIGLALIWPALTLTPAGREIITKELLRWA